MKYIFLLLCSNLCLAQEPIVYSLQWHQHRSGDKVVHFVSLSDRYWFNDHEDTLALPSAYFKQKNAPKYVQLNGIYRQRCLKATGISEHDVVHIYDYAKDKLLRFYVKGLKVVAVLNNYTRTDYEYMSQNEYMIGLEINPAYLEGFGRYYSHVLVSIGKTNPFTKGQMKPISWEKADPNQFPKNVTLPKSDSRLKNFERGETYQFKMNGMTYFIQNMGENGSRYARHLVVVNSMTKTILFEKIYQGSEGAGPAMLNRVENKDKTYFSQFTGQLFKNQPPVIFGFMYQSFGCPRISFIEKDKSPIYIHCDNRH